MSASAVQIRGTKNVIAAYKSNEAASFAIFCGKDLLTKYKGDDLEEGAEKLLEFVEVIRVGGSGALYQLRQYEDDVKKVTNETPWDYSFRFKVCEDESEERAGQWNGLRQEIADLKAIVMAQQQELDQEDEPESVNGGILGMVNQVLAKPEIQAMLMRTIGGWFSRVMNPGGSPAAMAGVSTEPAAPVSADELQATYDAMDPAEKEKLDEAIRILVTGDPAIGNNLLKIARILQTDPNKYRMFASML